MFPATSVRLRASDLLEQYGSEPNEPEVERVRLAILKLAGTDLERIGEEILGAKEDYEDTIGWAESPEEMCCRLEGVHLHGGDLRRVREDDKRRYEDWLAADGD